MGLCWASMKTTKRIKVDISEMENVSVASHPEYEVWESEFNFIFFQGRVSDLVAHISII